MITGLLGGILWALDTVILGIALSKAGFVSTPQAVALAPFISTFFHDLFSSLWMILYTTVKRQWKNVIYAVKTKSGKCIMLGALLGGPIGMSGYVAAIHFMGASYTAIVTSVYPAIGALLAKIFLKEEKMKWYQFISLGVSILGVILLGYTPGGADDVNNLYLGFGCAILCVVGWASEGVICAYGMKEPRITNEHALQIRQLISAVTYGLIIIPLLKGWGVAADLFLTRESAIILAAAFFGTASYLMYYKAIAKIGPSKAMPLNITYSAWSIVFSIFLLHTLPDLRSVLCCIIIVTASIITATDFRGITQKKKP